MRSFSEEIAYQLSMSGIVSCIRFDTVPNAVSSDGSQRPCRTYNLSFGDNKLRKGIQALYTDGTYRSIASPTPPKIKTIKRVKKTKRARKIETFITYEVFDASFVLIGQYKRKGWDLDELVFTDRDWVDVDNLVPILRGLCNRRPSNAKFKATIAEMYRTASLLDDLRSQDRFLSS